VTDLYQYLDFSGAFFSRGGYQFYIHAYFVYKNLDPFDQDPIVFKSDLILFLIVNTYLKVDLLSINDVEVMTSDYIEVYPEEVFNLKFYIEVEGDSVGFHPYQPTVEFIQLPAIHYANEEARNIMVPQWDDTNVTDAD
jgi:hypothetical protein